MIALGYLIMIVFGDIHNIIHDAIKCADVVRELASGRITNKVVKSSNSEYGATRVSPVLKDAIIDQLQPRSGLNRSDWVD